MAIACFSEPSSHSVDAVELVKLSSVIDTCGDVAVSQSAVEFLLLDEVHY